VPIDVASTAEFIEGPRNRMVLTTDDQEKAAIRASAIERHHVDADRFVQWYDEMARSRFANAFAYGRAKIDRLLDECFKTLHPGARVLDVGCGTGEYVQRANELGLSASGIEPAEAMRKAASEKNPGSTILNGVATELPFPDGTFDLVICIEVLRYLHSADNRQALREMYRVLKPGGILFLTMVNRYALDGFYLNYHARKFLGRKRVSGDAPHCEFTTPAEIDRQVLAAGFSKAVHRGVLLGPMRILYKLSTRIAQRIAPLLEPFDDAICTIHRTRAFAGHLVTVATR
jgi:ubiquinone/menaquinone biosynthesis C-methylase UbiE